MNEENAVFHRDAVPADETPREVVPRHEPPGAREVVLRYEPSGPREVVLRYEPPGPQEVVLRYRPPGLWEGVPCRVSPAAPEDAADAPLPAADGSAADGSAPNGAPERAASRKGLWIFLSCVAVLLVALVVLAVLYSRETATARRRGSADTAPRYEWREQLDAYADAETTIERYAGGDGTRLRCAETHGSALSIQEVYTRVNPCTVTVATALPNGGAIIGAGVIFTEDGYILTNAHVIAGGTQCYVVLDSGKSFDNVRLVGYDSEKDLAVIKVDGHLLPTAEFGDSDMLSVGDTVYAIGNPLGVELRGTLTDGIVSAINRDVSVDGVRMTLIQTNAALNNGNSGGPLINVYGQVVGINTMKMGSSSAVSVEGLGFAIPVSSAAWMVDDLIAYGEIRGEPILGLSVLRKNVTLPTGETALQIYELEPDGPGEKAGLALGDCIVRADGDPLESVNDLLRARRRYTAGEKVPLEIDRAGERFTVNVTLEKSPA